MVVSVAVVAVAIAADAVASNEAPTEAVEGALQLKRPFTSYPILSRPHIQFAVAERHQSVATPLVTTSN